MRRLLLTLAMLACVLPATAGAATLNATPANLQTQLAAARTGDKVQLSAASFGDVSVPSSTKAITVQGQPGTRLRRLITSTPGMVYDGLDIDAGGAKTAGAVVEFDGAGSVLRNSAVGNVTDEKGLLSHSGCDGCTYENVYFHDVRIKTDGVHNECVYSQSPNVKFRYSRFENCATMDVFFTRGTWWGQPEYGGFELVGNHFGKTFKLGGAVHYYTIVWGQVADRVRGIVARGNTFELPHSSGVPMEGVESCNTPPLDEIGVKVEPCAPTSPPPPAPEPEPAPAPAPEPTPEPEPAPAYAPACAPTCDEQIASLTAERDEWQRKAGVWQSKLVDIRAILDR